jgi:DNA-binding beta-propeller fold protein YncE
VEKMQSGGSRKISRACMSIHRTPKPGSGMTGARCLCRRALRASEFGLLGAASLAAATAMRPPPAASVPAATPPHYGFIKEIRLAGDGGWDYLSIDPTARRLYVAHDDHIDVVDIDHDTVVGSIAGTPGVHDIAIAHDLGRGFASDGQASQASIVDLNSLATIARVETAAGPDAIVYEPSRKEVYTFNGRDHSATVFDAQSGNVVATIALPGRPEFAVADPAAGRIYDNIEDKNLIVAIDVRSHAIVDQWPIAPGEGPTGLDIDTAHHRLFVGCHNQRMLMLDAGNGRVIALVPIGMGVDANVFDSGTQLAFSANGEGTVTIAHEDSPEKLSVVQTLQTQTGARTIALDPSTHNIYLATADLVPAPAASPGQSGAAAGPPRGRPAIVPGSFRILVYGPVRVVNP